MSAKRFWLRASLGLALGLVSSLSGCKSETRNSAQTSGRTVPGDINVVDRCKTPNEGCECPDEGAVVDCGRVAETHGDYVTCSQGSRTCMDGAWGACMGERAVVKELKSSATSALGSSLTGLGTPNDCPSGFDPCDPYCNQVVDTPDGTLTPPSGFLVTPSGLSLVATGVGGCTSLTLTPTPAKVTAGNIVTVTAFTASTLSTTPTGPVTFTLTALPAGCVASPYATTWTTNRPDRALIAGTTNLTGSLTLAIPIAGTIQVTAYAQGLSATANINVKVNFLDLPATSGAASPNVDATATQRSAFGAWNAPNPGTAAAEVTWLYPYPNTFFPLALPAPTIQYWYTNTGGSGTTAAVASTDRAVKVSLRYPANTSSNPAAAMYSDFNYSLVVRESNTVSQTASVSEDSRDPQVVIPQAAWAYFEQTARGNNADLVIQRYRNGTGANDLEAESRQTIRFVDGQLKGTIYYNSYSSPQGSNTGAVLSIAPGATTPALAVQPSGRCTVCHSLNGDGTRLIVNTTAAPAVGPVNQSRRYNMTTAGPSPAFLNSYPGGDGPIPAPGGVTAVVKTPAAPAAPSVTVSGTPVEDGLGSIRVTTGGARGTARFSWEYDAHFATNVLTAATVALGATGITAAFSTGTYVVGTTYEWSGAASINSKAGQYFANKLGDRYTFGGPWGDGSLYMTHGGKAAGTVGVGDPNFRAPPDYSGLYSVTDPSIRLGVTNWPSNMLAVTPRFSKDGTKLVFGYWGGDTLPRTPAGTLSSVAAGTRLSVATFSVTCTTPPCTSASPGLSATVSNARDLTPGVTQRVAWPSFTPGGDAVIYQRQYRTSKSRNELDVLQTGGGPAATLTGVATTSGTGLITITTGGVRGTARFNWSYGSASGTNVVTASSVVLGLTGLIVQFPSGTYVAATTYGWDLGVLGGPGWPQWGGWSPSHVNSSAGALAELWLSNVPANSSTAATPTRLLALNGLNSAGTSYLPDDNRPVSPPAIGYHRKAGASFSITQADSCTNTGIANDVYDHRLNYLPAVNPTQAGGFSWVVFTSRRMYGNVAYNDPWDAKAGSGCDAGRPPTKKLWVAAIDGTITPGADPSHPAFYLPGQELNAGNSNGEWVSSPCLTTGVACLSNDDCCGATGASPTTSCKVMSASTVPPTRQCQSLSSCSAPGAACTTTTDCCTGICPAGGGVCLVVPPPIYETQLYQREYLAACPSGTSVKWRFFEYQATIPAGTRVDFSVQTKQTAAATYQPVTPLGLGSATVTTPVNTWARGTNTVDQVLVTGGLWSKSYILVRMSFVPNASGLAAPTLKNWRQIYDCVPAE